MVVDATGQRAYAASAKGGVWYTRDGGSTWDPLGGWAAGNRGAGGINTPHACGTVMVAFDPGGDENLDLVMVGTGEPPGNASDESVPVHGGVGVFAAVGPAGVAAGVEPWEAETGLACSLGRASTDWREIRWRRRARPPIRNATACSLRPPGACSSARAPGCRPTVPHRSTTSTGGLCTTQG